MKRYILTALALTLALTITVGGCQKEDPDDESGNVPDDSEYVDDTDWSGTVFYNDVEYRRRTDVRTILFLGVDNTNTSEFAEGVVGNNGRSDAIMLFITDTKTKKTQLLTVSRDTITEVDVYSGNGELVYSRPMQLTLQYSFGDSARRSCFLAQRTISELLYDARIDGYFSMTMDGIPVVVEELGGLTVTMNEDYTYIDERYVQGATVTMDGQEAEHFVRYRDLTQNGSNEDRNLRQSWFVTEMFKQMKANGDLESTVERIMEAAQDYIETNIDGESLALLAGSEMTETYKVPGESRPGPVNNEFIVDEDGLRELVIKLFYVPKEPLGQ